MTTPLDVSASGIIGSNAIGSVELAPMAYGVRWNIRRMVVSSTSAKQTECRVYLGFVSINRLQATTFIGNEDYNETDITLQTLDRLIAMWTNGVPGAIVTLQLQGLVLPYGTRSR